MTFSAAVSGNPRSILNQSAGFGINARSGTDFLAFNTVVNAISDRLSFASPASNFSIYVGFRDTANYTASYFSSANVLIGTQTITVAGGTYGQLFQAGSVLFVDISSTSFAWVADDLSYDTAMLSAVPESVTCATMLAGFGIVGGAMRRHSAARVSATGKCQPDTSPCNNARRCAATGMSTSSSLKTALEATIR